MQLWKTFTPEMANYELRDYGLKENKLKLEIMRNTFPSYD